MLEVRLFTKVLGHKMDEVTGQWESLHIEQLRELH